MTSQVEATNRAVLQASSAHPRAGDAEMLRRTSILKTGELGYVRRPQWQVLVDRHSNRFIQGRRVADVPGLSAVQWVPLDTNDPLDFGARLVAVATNNTTVSSAEAEAEGGLTADSGRIVVLDFERSTRNGKHFSETLELGGSDFVELEEEEMDHDTEVILARRRTIAERIEAERQSAIQLDRDRSADRRTRAEAEDVPIMPMYRGEKAEHQRAPLQSSNAGPSNRRESFEDGPSLEEAEAMAGPFSLGGPRSRNLIGTVAAVRHPEPPPLPPSGQVRYRRAETGDVPRTPRQVPHESDADNWVPPPPPYSKDAQEPLPDHLLDTLRSSRSLSDLSRRSSGANYPIPVTRNRTSANLTRGPSTRSALSSTVASASIQSGRARSRSPPIRGRSLVTTPETARSLAEDGADTDSNDEEIAGARATPHRRTDSLPVSHTFSEDPEVRNQTRPNGPAVGRSRGAARQRNMPPVPELAAAGSPDRAASESPLMSATITDLSSTTHPYDLGLDLTPPLTASEMSAVQSRPGSMVGRRLTREPQEMEDGAIPPMPPIPPSVLPLVQTAVSPVTHFHESPLGISNLAPGIPGNPPPTPIEHISALARRTSTGPDGIGGSQLNRNSSLVGSREISMDRRSQSLSLKKPTVKAGSSALRAPASPVMHGNGSSRYSATESQMAAAREAHVRNTAAMSQPMVDRVPTGRRRKNVESNDDEDSHRQQRATPGRMETIPSVPSREASVMSHVNRKPKTRSRSRSRHRDENREDRVPDQLPSMFAPSTLRGPMIRDGADGNPTPAGNNPRVGSPRIGSLSTARAWISSSLNSGTPKSPHTPSITPRSGSMPSVFSHRQQNLDRIERDDNYPGPVRSATMQMYGSAHTGPTGGGPPQAPIDSLPSRSRSRPDVDDDGVSRPSMSASQHTTAASTGISNSRPTPTPPPGASSLHNHSTPVSRPDSRPDSASKREQDRVENGSGSGGGGSSGEKVASKVRTWAAKRQERDRALYGIEGAHGAEDEEDVGPNLAGLSAALTPRIGTVKRKGFGVVGRGRIGKSRVDKGKEREVLGMGAGDGDDDDDDDDAGERAGGIMGHARRGSGLGIAFASRKPSRAGTNKSRDRRGGDGSGGGGSSLRRFGARCSIM